MIEKNLLRRRMKEIRDGLSPVYRKEAADSCRRQVLESSFYKEADWVYTYISFDSEMDTRDLICDMLKDGKHVAVPKIQGDKMEFHEIHSLSECRPGVWGIPEPVMEACVTESGLMLMPGLAFDKEGRRLGYGAGYYDKYLALHPGHYCCGLAYKEQVIEKVPANEYDISIHYLFTPV